MPAHPNSAPAPRAGRALRSLLDSRSRAHIWRASVTLTITRIAPTEQLLVLALRGVLDYASAPKVRAAISAAAARRPAPQLIVLDLSGVDDVDDTGVATVVVGNRLCRQIGIDFGVRRPAPLVRRLLGLNGTVSDAHEVGVVKVGSG
jgi:anti-anti-sigma factor